MPDKFTPGPWATAATDDSLVVKGKLKIASAFMDVPREEEEANARLIASAPRLLNALRGLHKKCVIGTDAERHAALNEAWSAIYEATETVNA